jgi:hypothetical protein
LTSKSMEIGDFAWYKRKTSAYLTQNERPFEFNRKISAYFNPVPVTPRQELLLYFGHTKKYLNLFELLKNITDIEIQEQYNRQKLSS